MQPMTVDFVLTMGGMNGSLALLTDGCGQAISKSLKPRRSWRPSFATTTESPQIFNHALDPFKRSAIAHFGLTWTFPSNEAQLEMSSFI